MSPADLRDAYLRTVAARAGTLSRFLSIQRDLLHYLVADGGRVAIIAARDAALVVIEEYRGLEEEHEANLAAGLYRPLPPLEEVIACRRQLAAAVGERLALLMEKRIPQSYPEPRRLYFGGSGKLIPPPEG